MFVIKELTKSLNHIVYLFIWKQSDKGRLTSLTCHYTRTQKLINILAQRKKNK